MTPPKAERRSRALARARKLRRVAAELDARGVSLTRHMAVLDGERAQLFARAERLRWQAETIEEG